MLDFANELPEDVDELKAMVAAQSRHFEAKLAERDALLKNRDRTIEQLREHINVLLAKRYGASKETVDEAQLSLFNEAEELEAQPEEEAPATPVAAHTRVKPKRKPLPEHLPRIRIEHHLPEDEQTCPKHGVAMERFDEETSEQLDIVPATVQVLLHVRGKYRCPCCTGRIRTAPMPAQPIPKSMASPGLLAHITTAKYLDAVPLYRQQRQLQRIGMEVSRTTLAFWMVTLGHLVQPLINLLREQMLSGDYLLLDETTLQVLKELGKTAESKSYIWAQMNPDPDNLVILFDYDPSRSAEVPKRLLAGYTGTLHTDGYSGYDAVVREQNLIRLFCWSHCRRRFVDVLKSLGLNPKKLPSKPPPKAQRALTAIGYIKTLYAIERRIKDRPPDERLRVRQGESLPVLDKLREWLTETRPKITPSSKLGEALKYMDDHWPGLVRYCEDGRYLMDTNRIENAIRPFAIGRRNWLFSDSVAGANGSAALYSLVQTAIANGLEPYRYLRHVFTELPKAETVEDIEALLPTRLDPAEFNAG